MCETTNSTAVIENSSKNAFDNQIDIISLMMVMLKKIWIIILAALVVGGACFSGAKFLITPTYQASFTAYVNNRSQQSNYQDTISSNDLTAVEKLVSAYSKTITSRNILQSAASRAGMDDEYDVLAEMVSTQVESDTGIVHVYVVDTSPESAYQLAKSIAKVAPELIPDIIEGSSMKIIDMPTLPDSIYKPSYLKWTAIGVLLGGMLAAAYIMIRVLMDDKVKNENDLESRFSLPVVGVIPDMMNTSKGSHNYYDYEYAYRNSEIKRSGNYGKKQ